MIVLLVSDKRSDVMLQQQGGALQHAVGGFSRDSLSLSNLATFLFFLFFFFGWWVWLHR